MSHNKLPPTPRVGLVCRPAVVGRRIAQLSFFFLRRSFFESSALAATRMRWSGRIFWLLAQRSGNRRTTFFPPSPPKSFRRLAMGSRIQLQQRNCSRFTRDFSRRSTFL